MSSPAGSPLITNIVLSIKKLVEKMLGDHIFVGTVSTVSSNTVQITRPAAADMDNTFYPALNSSGAALIANDQVLVVKAGASYAVLGRVSSGTVFGTVSLPAQVAGTYQITVSDVRVSASGHVFCQVKNDSADVTANRGVFAWSTGVFTPGTSFQVEYRTNATMAHPWTLLYWIVA